MSPARSARSARPAWLVPGLVLGLVLAAAGCASWHPARRRPQPSVRALAAEYLAIARPANYRLDVPVEAYADHSHHKLPAAEARPGRQSAGQSAVTRLPPGIAPAASALIRVNEIRARMTERQARARSVPALLSFDAGHKMADAQVEAQVKVIRAQLGLPPPSI